jgi:hypothetical protein
MSEFGEGRASSPSQARRRSSPFHVETHSKFDLLGENWMKTEAVRVALCSTVDVASGHPNHDCETTDHNAGIEQFPRDSFDQSLGTFALSSDLMVLKLGPRD